MSDDSDYESDYETGSTSVYLGFADDAADDFMTAQDNHIGGQPIWLHPESAPDSKLTQCDNCKEQMHLLTQISAPLVEGEFYDRVLYVFLCPQNDCKRKEGSTRALRAIRRDEAYENDQKRQEKEVLENSEKEKKKRSDNIDKMSESIFSDTLGGGGGEGGSNPFASGNPFESSAKPFTESTASKTSQRTEEPTISESSNPAVDIPKTGSALQSTKLPEFKPCYYITVDSEVLTEKEEEPLDKDKIEYLEEEIEGAASTTAAPSNDDDSEKKDIMKAVEAAANDKTFLHFTKIVDCNAEQVVRYEPQTLEPLLYRNNDSVAKELEKGIKGKKLELQVMPYTIMLLEPEQSLSEGMEWGTIYVATSTNDEEMPSTLDKNGVGYVQEWCGVQWEG